MTYYRECQKCETAIELNPEIEAEPESWICLDCEWEGWVYQNSKRNPNHIFCPYCGEGSIKVRPSADVAIMTFGAYPS